MAEREVEKKPNATKDVFETGRSDSRTEHVERVTLAYSPAAVATATKRWQHPQRRHSRADSHVQRRRPCIRNTQNTSATMQ